MTLLSPLLLFAVSVAAQPSISDYAPSLNAPCPAPTVGVFVRPATDTVVQTLNIQEESYRDAREAYAIPTAWLEWLGDGSAIGYPLASFSGSLPRIGVAVGGRGLRAAQFGAAVFSALDATNATAKTTGTGGLLQVASYLVGSSGGSWLIASLALNDWPSVSTLVHGDGHALSGWMLDLDLFAPSSPEPAVSGNQEYWASVLASVEAKAQASIDTSLADLLGRVVSYHFLNGTTRDNFFTNKSAHGAGQLWSQIPFLPSYDVNQTMPFPIIVADSLPSGSNATSVVPLGSVVYEFTPFEFGSWDPSLAAMFPMAYAGSRLVNGTPPSASSCVTGFDQAGFIMGSSASNFNDAPNGPYGNFSGFDNQNGDASGIQFLYNKLSSAVKSRSFNVANWPNSFKGISPDTFQDSTSDWLSLVDGGSNGEQIPLGSLFAKARAVDVVVAVDASADDPNQWPNGTSLLASSQRTSSILSSSHRSFPPIPSSAQDFISAGVNQRPTFFGCNPSQTPPEYPLIIYIPNSPPMDGSAPASNTGDLQFSYSPQSTAVFIDQAFSNTLGGFKPHSTSPDPNWGKCLQCAALDRARFKLTPVPSRSAVCSQCFSQYCYDPSHPPSADELPDRRYVYLNPNPGGFNEVKAFLSRQKDAIIGGVVAVVCVICVGIAFIFWWRRRTERKNRYTRMDVLRKDDEPWKYYDTYSSEHEMHRLSLLE